MSENNTNDAIYISIFYNEGWIESAHTTFFDATEHLKQVAEEYKYDKSIMESMQIERFVPDAIYKPQVSIQLDFNEQ